MLHKRIDIPKDNYYQIMTKLGSIFSSMEFEDLNKNELETYKSHYSIINRCDEIETVFSHLDDILINHFNIQYELYKDYNAFQIHLNYEMKKGGNVKENVFFDVIQNIMFEEENKIKTQFNLNKQQIESFHKLLEKKYIYEKMVELFGYKIIYDDNKDGQLNLDYVELNDEDEDINLIGQKSSDFKINNSLKYLCGICDTEDVMKIRRLIFRAGRGLSVPSFYYPTINKNKIILDEEKYLENKQIFLILITGQNVFEKIKSRLEVLNIETFHINNALKIKHDLENINAEVSSQKEILQDTEKVLLNMIKPNTSPVIIDGNKYLCIYSLYRTFCRRERYIYMNLNKCEARDMYYVGDVWIPKIAYSNLLNKLNELTNLPVFRDSDKQNFEPKVRTYFKMDDFVYPFQTIVNTYGIPRYKEVNPGLFTIITFPFLFGIMFGDIGHGFLIFLLSIYIEVNRKQIKESNSLLKELLKYRYILLLMGFFSFFCGIIYNDFMSIPLTFFSSCYINNENEKVAVRKDKCTYPIGIDPKWYSSSNELTFMNSFKMKWSVIVGVIQMTLGIILRGLNNLYFGDYYGFFFEFIPQLIFMTLLFGYMIALIFIKWNTDYTGNTENAPSIITILMNLALKNGSVDGKPVWTSVEKEEWTNKVFFYISLLCIPVILLPKPIIQIVQKHFKEKKDNDINININPELDRNNEFPAFNIDNDNNIDEIEPFLNEGDLLKAEHLYENEKSFTLDKRLKQQHEMEQSASDIFVHQIIETIEFALGCVSNTASYLRLWALSLAHSQLSKVFFEKSLLGLAVTTNFVIVIFGYFIFANITISVLMGMDLLEAFLHTLRLHWVEFQNKFYYADGIEFCPYSFDLLLSNEK